jgi:branched-chain amino acid transport system ATP-binding protein
LLRIENLIVKYGSAQAVQDVSLSLSPGEIVALIGPNGAGKTSLVRAVGGLIRPAQGRVLLREKDVTGVPAERIVQLGAVLVPEGRMIFTRLTVRENLLVAAYTRRDHAEVTRDITHIGRRFPFLAERAEQLASSLSGGERQLLAIGRALMARPALMMVDEPSHGLSPIAVRNVFRLIADLNAEGMTILLVEQNARQSLQIAHRAYVMQAGRIVLSGTAADLRRDDAVIRAYLGVKHVAVGATVASTAKGA